MQLLNEEFHPLEAIFFYACLTFKSFKKFWNVIKIALIFVNRWDSPSSLPEGY